MSDAVKPPTPPPSDSESPGVPGFRSWRTLYGFVLVIFVITVVLLAGFAGMFS